MSRRGTVDLGPRYQCLRELGHGGMGRVILVHDLHFDRRLALKLIQAPSGSVEEIEQIQREFTLLSQLDHPAIARAYDFGYLGGVPYFTSEYISGSRPAEAAGIEDDALLQVAFGAAGAAAFLHEKGILHLDIKPANVLVPEDAGRGGASSR